MSLESKLTPVELCEHRYVREHQTTWKLEGNELTLYTCQAPSVGKYVGAPHCGNTMAAPTIDITKYMILCYFCDSTYYVKKEEKK